MSKNRARLCRVYSDKVYFLPGVFKGASLPLWGRLFCLMPGGNLLEKGRLDFDPFTADEFPITEGIESPTDGFNPCRQRRGIGLP